MSITLRAILFLSIIFFLSAFVVREMASSKLAGHGETIDEIIVRESIDPATIEVLISKKKRTLSLVAEGKVLKSYKAVLGQVPEGDKFMQGDLKTPEGNFKVRAKYPHSEWHKFIWIDYPNEESRKKFRTRLQQGDIPEDAKIGGEIGIHGVPTGMDLWIDLGSDWTLGCIALKNNAVDEVYKYVNEGTPIRIEP